MADGTRINLKPFYRQETVPCEGRVGDLIVITPLDEGEHDGSAQGLASLWLCTKSQDDNEGVPAVWKRVDFDGVGQCDRPMPDPPQNDPALNRG